ncbi:MAG: RNA 2',3'-cyclic phosphodiesterase [Candidatus Aenigmatarchaeota archaeon]
MRCFIAVELDRSLQKRVIDIQRDLLEDAVRPVGPENLHITLRFLDEQDEQNVNEIVKVLEGVCHRPFEIRFADIGVFPRLNHINVVWIGVKGPLRELVDKINLQLTDVGIPAEEKPFSAHLTIARVSRKPELLVERVQKLKGIQLGSQKVTSFVLKKSILTPDGPIYEDIKRYELL